MEEEIKYKLVFSLSLINLMDKFVQGNNSDNVWLYIFIFYVYVCYVYIYKWNEWQQWQKGWEREIGILLL